MFVSTALKKLSTVAVGTAAIALSFGSAVRAASLYNITRIRPPESPFIANLATDIDENGKAFDLNI
ncbi:hypothetical protein [Oscillatoria sp. FACHB-1406]|uniref:hypothetical protein n=1 Tax=Oscillatoria sp. FACHB-1406 TaxID=2692846 RepID=UPI0016880225|nr:hypothetical protein [Oscillatoria sp. FACHB-1406]MBD2579519.1 hypothetical protein [Oscillatoria sp. FACHB-1406]